MELNAGPFFRAHPRTRGLRRIGRIAACAALALLMHLSAWQTLAGIRVSLARSPDEAPPVEVALIGPAAVPSALPGRRAVVRMAGSGQRSAAALQATVGVAHGAAHRAPGSPPAPLPAPARPPAPPAPPPEPAQAPAPVPDRAQDTPPAPAPQPVPSPQAPAAAPPAPAEANESTQPEAPPAPPAPQAAAEPQVRSAAQVVLPRSARFVYDSHGTVRLGGFSLAVTGRTTTVWRFEEGHYQSDLSIDVASFAQSSRGQFDPQVGLAPDRYTETRRRNKVLSADFDWARRRVTFADPAGEKPAEPGAQDFLSIHYQLSVLRQIYPERFVRGGLVPVTMAGTGDIRPWVFTVTGDDIVDSGLGRLHALRIVSNRSTETGDESLEVWLCERLHWFPARIRMVDRHRNMFDFVLDEATIE